MTGPTGLRAAQVAIVIPIIAEIEAIVILIAVRRRRRTGIATPIVLLPTGTAATTVTRTVIMHIHREDMPITARAGARHISAWIGTTGRLIGVRGKATLLVHRAETADLSMDRLARRADLSIADLPDQRWDPTEAPVLAATGQIDLLAHLEPTAGLSVGRRARRADLPIADLPDQRWDTTKAPVLAATGQIDLLPHLGPTAGLSVGRRARRGNLPSAGRTVDARMPIVALAADLLVLNAHELIADANADLMANVERTVARATRIDDMTMNVLGDH